jgi:HNH endonuclease
MPLKFKRHAFTCAGCGEHQELGHKGQQYCSHQCADRARRVSEVPDEVKQRTGICGCGCGGRTTIARKSQPHLGLYAGYPNRFIYRHTVTPTGRDSNNWRGGKWVDPRGYIRIYRPEHPRAQDNGYVYEHVLIAEKALGRYLDAKHEVHHFDENPSNNANSNLIVCEDHSYHQLLHERTRHLAKKGHPSAKLTPLQALEIKARSEYGDTQRDIAKDYGVAQRTVGNIVNGRSWKHIR